MDVKLKHILDIENLQKMIDEGYINTNTHSEFGYKLFNYSRLAQYERVWNEETLACRGLIVDSDDFEKATVIARPFPKFFNASEHESQAELLGTLPVHSEFAAYDKLDGSLGILYSTPKGAAIATRGSFTSDQALFATELLKNHKFDPNPVGTLLFEIIAPWNRIVVDYGTDEKLVLLAHINKSTGDDLKLPSWDGETVKTWNFKNFSEVLKYPELENSEGFVVRFFGPGLQRDVRTKIKFEEYVRLHKIVTGVNKKTVWQYLRDGHNIDAFLENVPDEFDDWVREVVENLTTQKDKILNEATTVAENVRGLPRREAAEKILASGANSGIAFSVLDRKNPDAALWKLVEPSAETPFQGEG